MSAEMKKVSPCSPFIVFEMMDTCKTEPFLGDCFDIALFICSASHLHPKPCDM